MSESFGLKIGLEGEKEFKKALADINQSFKVLGSEMRLVESQFSKNDTSVSALTARNEVLNKEIEVQKQKIETLRSALASAAESFGEADRRTQNWQIQLNNAEAALNGMESELKDNNEAIEKADKNMDDAADSADKLEEKVDDAGDAAEKSENKFSKFGSVLKTVGAAMGAAVVAAGAMAVKLGTEVVEAYADYEQLVGGIDTLFKENSESLQTYAANAYKTAGLSANDYMETVTSFSASLIGSLGGDTKKAVEFADMAITDMADNANKMGSDISFIQTAYQGFAKGQFTLLDNLKLGYGGTKTEMERLLADAKAISGVKYNIDSYADIVSAIHVIQESMDITGTTAKEAEHTISGSVSAMKSSLQNLLVGFGDANADMEMLCKNVADAFNNVVENITPVIENIVKAMPTAINALLDAVVDLLPTLLESFTSLVGSVLTMLIETIPQLIPIIVDAVMTIVNALVDNLPLLVKAAMQIITALINGITTALPDLIPAIIEAIILIVETIIDNADMLLGAAFALIQGLSQGLLDALPVLIAALPEIINSIINFLLAAIPQIIETGIQLLTSLVDALPTIIITIVNAIPDIISGIINAVLDNLPLIIQSGVRLFVALIENLPKIIVEIVKAVPQIIAGLVGAFGNGVTKMAEIGGNLVKGLWEGIQGLSSWLWDKVSGWISGIWDGICDFFGIASPSKEMAWIGEMMTKGLANGIEDSGDQAVKAVTDMGEDIDSAMTDIAKEMKTSIPTDFDLSANAKVTASVPNSFDYGGVSLEGIVSGIVSGVKDILTDLLPSGDTVIPVYIGGNLLDEVIVTAQQRVNLRSGGR